MTDNAIKVSTMFDGTGATSRRKLEHIRICSEMDVEFEKTTGFERFEFVHQALPELDLSEIDTSTTFFGKRFKLPFFIEAITGGSPGTEKINLNLARAAETMQIGMGLGSQRAMLDNPDLTYTYQVRSTAPGILLLGNIGAVQLPNLHVDEIDNMIRAIGADGLAVHLNAAQELCQPEGDRDWRCIVSHIERVCRDSAFPVVVKETGCGIAGGIGRLLESAGVAGLDIAGAGGTSFTKVEYYRRGASHARAFSEWGIPTAESLRQCRCVTNIPMIASGGLRTGVACAKAIAMGATLVGFALPLLKPAMQSHRDVIRILRRFEQELKMAMLLAGAPNIEALAMTPLMDKNSMTYIDKAVGGYS